MEIAITKMSSKGQIVIPLEMRKNIKAGDKLLIIEDKGQFIIKKSSDLDVKFKEDIEFAKKTEEAYQRIKSGKGKKMKAEDFLEEMKKW